MNFFEHQDRARGTTRKLVILFILAVASLIFITTFLVAAVFSASESASGTVGMNSGFLSSELFLGVALLVVAVVLLGMLFRMAQLRGGGHVVAEGLGGRLLNRNTGDPDERKILNVVEEMAIAAGLPVPPVYLLEDPAINAFAAGFQQQDAVIGVTRGCIHQLSRDELQGVIAHEFSHIFNGDMRLNIRLMGWLYGIMVIGLIGYFILRGGMYGAAMHHRRRDGKGQGGLLALGLGLVVVGYGGTFFGNLIKAAVSRQREFLADASAVQYTRNPDGIGGALKKIAASSQGSMLSSTDASEVSHMLFGQGIKAGFTGLFATHPPLEERIKRVQPDWDGKLDGIERAEPPRAATAQGAATASGFAAAAVAGAVIDAAGEPGEEHLQQARRQLDSLPERLRNEAQDPLGAMLLMYGLVVLASDSLQRPQLQTLLQDKLPLARFRHCLGLFDALEPLPRELKLTLVELALPSLKQLSESQALDFLRLLQALIKADRHVSLYEWSLFRLLQMHLSPAGGRPAQTELKRCGEEVAVLLAVLAAAGNPDPEAAGAAYAAGFAELGTRPVPAMPSAEQRELEAMERAIGKLQGLKPLQKPRLLKAMVACIAHDGRLMPAEVELLRAVGALLDCPLPPLPETSGA